MNNYFIEKSKNLLLNFLKEPGGFSFFPSSFFWGKNIKNDYLENIYKVYFNSNFYTIKNGLNKTNLYVHIPFCTKICSYCNCFKYKLREKKEIDRYLSYLEKEIILIRRKNNNNKININTIFIGGGTPNLLTNKQFSKLYKIIKNNFNLEFLEQFLIDGHPNYWEEDKLFFLKNIGVNRVTFAIQTFNNTILKNNNRDIYNIDLLNKNLKFAKKNGLKINIDLLIGLKGQTIDIVKNDLDIVNDFNIDNISIHYLMVSNNINYILDDNYLNLVRDVKKYLKSTKVNNYSSNITEDYFISKRSTTISVGATAVTNIFSKIIYSKPEIDIYYKELDKNIIPIDKGLILEEKDEMIKYIYLNILYGINILEFEKLFGENIFKIFIKEFKFLRDNDIVYIKNNYLFSKKSDLETLLYFNIFFLEKFSNFNVNKYNKNELNYFFLNNGELIDK